MYLFSMFLLLSLFFCIFKDLDMFADVIISFLYLKSHLFCISPYLFLYFAISFLYLFVPDSHEKVLVFLYLFCISE